MLVTRCSSVSEISLTLLIETVITIINTLIFTRRVHICTLLVKISVLMIVYRKISVSINDLHYCMNAIKKFGDRKRENILHAMLFKHEGSDFRFERPKGIA